MKLIFNKYRLQLIKEYEKLKKDKKLIILGTGSLFKKIKTLFNINIDRDVFMFIETKPKNKSFCGKKVIPIKDLNRHIGNKEEVSILVCSSAWKEIKKELPESTLSSFEWYNPYEEMRWIFQKDSYPIVTLEKNIRNLLLKYKGEIPRKRNESIAFLIGERAGSPNPYYFITLGVLLRLHGMNVHFLYNDLSKYGDVLLGEGFNEFQNYILEKILEEISLKYDITIEKLSNQNRVKLNDKERKTINQFIYYNKVSYSKKIIFDDEDRKMLDIFEKSWLVNAELIKGFLEKHPFEKVYVWSGVHLEWALLRILAEVKGIKTYSSEYIRDGYSFSINGPTVFQKDSTLIDKKRISENQYNQLINFSNNYLENKLKKIEKFPVNSPYVVIPLNIFWDSAAFSLNDIFIYYDKWLLKTISFLLEECNIQVYVRQHPHESKFNTGKEVEKLLNRNFGDHKLYTFIDSHSDVNTYSLVQSSQLVLPNTSTVGLEAAMMGKQVILKNDVYYANLGFCQKANDEHEYFHLIKEALSNPKELSKEQIENAKYYFALTMNNSTKPFFGDCYEVKEWSSLELDTILENESVKWLIDLIMNNKLLLENKLSI